MRGSNESKGNKMKDFDSFDIMSFIYSNNNLPLRPNGRIFFVLMRHFSFSCGNPARPRPGENSGIMGVSKIENWVVKYLTQTTRVDILCYKHKTTKFDMVGE